MVKVREVRLGDREEWLRMREALWPDSLADHDADTRRYFDAPEVGRVTFVAERDENLVGFLELEYRKYAPDCVSSPVPFIEGWYVDEGVRRQGVGRALFRAAEDWARAHGHTEIASDVEIDNATSLAAHEALGYEETERVVYFRRSLK